jgi:hypothetical protein
MGVRTNCSYELTSMIPHLPICSLTSRLKRIWEKIAQGALPTSALPGPSESLPEPSHLLKSESRPIVWRYRSFSPFPIVALFTDYPTIYLMRVVYRLTTERTFAPISRRSAQFLTPSPLGGTTELYFSCIRW